jgi:hypothetical protein
MRLVFSWSPENAAHASRHGVSTAEAEHVVRHASAPWPTEIEGDKLLVWGRTEVGRFVQVVFALLDDDHVDPDTLSLEDLIDFSDGNARVAYVIHAMELTDAMKKQYRKRKG